MWGEELRFEKEGVMALIGMDADPGDRGSGFFQETDEAGLLGWFEAGVGIDAEDEEALGSAAREEVDKVVGAGFGQEVEPLPGIEDAEVGIGIESGDEFFTLVEEVGFDRVIQFVPAKW